VVNAAVGPGPEDYWGFPDTLSKEKRVLRYVLRATAINILAHNPI